MPLENEPATVTLEPNRSEEPPRLGSGTEYERSGIHDEAGNAPRQGWQFLCVYSGKSSTVLVQDDEERWWASLARRALQRWMEENPY